MPSHPVLAGPRRGRRARRLRPCLLQLEQRVVLSLQFPGLAGITFDSSGDVFVSYDSTPRFSSEPQESVAEFDPNGNLVNAAVFTATGAGDVSGRSHHGRVVGRAPHHYRPHRHARAPAQRPALRLQCLTPTHPSHRMTIWPATSRMRRRYLTFRQARMLT